MNKETLINIINQAKINHKSNYIEIMGLFMIYYIDDKDINLTDDWNLAEELSRKNIISIYDMNDVWKAINELTGMRKFRVNTLED